jgi:small-conductance mechanosensitive channel
MEFVKDGWTALLPGVPLVVTLVVGILLLVGASRILERYYRGRTDRNMRLQIIMLLLSFVLLVVVVLAAPINDTQKGQILSLVGLVLSAAIALSSTTFVGNAMAGLMMGAVKGFRVGDFVSIGEHFGRVTERGLFHVEIQTEQRDLVTLPNLHLVTHPVRVVRSSGTIVYAEVSLGYDVHREPIKEALLRAAATVELQDPYVQIVNLGDFSVVYRISGLLTEVKQLLTCRSRLRGAAMDELHAAGIEIVSPNFMNTRAVDPQTRFVPQPVRRTKEAHSEALPEEMVFDKADEAESHDQQVQRLAQLEAEIKQREEALAKTGDGQEKEQQGVRIEKMKRLRDTLAARLDAVGEDGKQAP